MIQYWRGIRLAELMELRLIYTRYHYLAADSFRFLSPLYFLPNVFMQLFLTPPPPPLFAFYSGAEGCAEAGRKLRWGSFNAQRSLLGSDLQTAHFHEEV